jgi:agmatinase
VVGDAPVYVSFDVDVLDPSVTPGTGTPEAGGLSARQAIAMLTGLAGLNVVGGDVVEVAPAYDPSISTALTAAQILFEILCLMALSPDQPTTTSA